MKKFILFGLVLVAVLMFAAFAAPAADAGTIAGCWSDPAEGPVGTVFTVHCAGFSPDTMVWPYYVEPDGSATALCYGFFNTSGCQFKTDENGSISFTFNSKQGNWAAALGTWTVVVEKTGLAGAVLERAQAGFRVTGGTEGVSGAHVWASADAVQKGDWVTIYGSGFAPYEIVNLWWEFPNGDCSSMTGHFAPTFNFRYFYGASAVGIDEVKTNAAGEFASSGFFVPWDCEGKYRFVARGNSSWNGGETWVTVTGHAVETNAWLTASKSTVTAINDPISFSGWGYGANESVTCWLRSPQGQVLPIYHYPEIKTTASGTFSFNTFTGGVYPGWNFFSEGALGNYAMSCRGNLSGATAIAEFMVTGGIVDP